MHSHHFASSLAVLLLLAAAAPNSACAATFQTWGAVGFPDHRVAGVCSPPAGPPICYKNIYGRFHYSCDFAANRVVVRQCTGDKCLSGCTDVATLNADGAGVRSQIAGTKVYNWTGVFYNSTSGWAVEESHWTPGTCSDAPYAVSVQPASATQCAPYADDWSQKWFLAAGRVFGVKYLGRDCETIWSGRDFANGSCSSGNSTRYAIYGDSGSMTTHVVMFGFAAAGHVASLVASSVAVLALALIAAM